jgi:hypothetical protein
MKSKQQYVEQGESAGEKLAWQITKEERIQTPDGSITMYPLFLFTTNSINPKTKGSEDMDNFLRKAILPIIK